MTCTGTCGSGWRTVGTLSIEVLRVMGARGRAVGSVRCACCAAAPGTTARGASAPPPAAGAPPRAGTTTSASELPGRSPRESLPLSLFGGPGGGALWSSGRCVLAPEGLFRAVGRQRSRHENHANPTPSPTPANTNPRHVSPGCRCPVSPEPSRLCRSAECGSSMVETHPGESRRCVDSPSAGIAYEDGRRPNWTRLARDESSLTLPIGCTPHR